MKPMLAAAVEVDSILESKFPLLASPKLDGIRAIVKAGKVYSRNLKPIPNAHVQKILTTLPSGFDGELICGSPTSKTCFRDTTSGCMTSDGIPDFTFYVFDYCDVNIGYIDRYRDLQQFFKRYRNKNVRLLPNTRIKDMFSLKEYEDEMLSRGYEGVMLRTPNAPYKFGRSTLKEGYLMKLKRFEDSEARILEVIELKHNMNEAKLDELGRTKRSSHKEGKVSGGTMGAIRVQDLYSGVVFEIGAGFTQEERDWFWENRETPIEKWVPVKYKYFPTGSKDKPRFPVYLGFRPE